MGITCTIKNYKALQNRIDKLQDAPEKVIKNTLSDVRSRGPGWVASEVVKHYNVKKGELTGGKLGSMKVEGNGLDNVKIIYKGRLLTPVHFNMSPQAPRQGTYTIKATITKGNRKALGHVKKLTKKQRQNIGRNLTQQGTRNSPKSPWMLSTTGNKKAGGVDFIPFQRREQPGKLQFVFRTLSMPQMVSSDRAGPGVEKNVNENIEKRFEHHMARFMK